MANATASTVPTDLTSPVKTSLKITDILGIALFDLSGLPREYFVTEENPTTGWVQIVFQALGLRSLLTSSLELEGFHQITINLEATTAMVVRRKKDYIALQFKGKLALQNPADEERLLNLIAALNPDKLRQHPHFQVY
ncbi:hypothetical protein [Leptolyngbya iicbica]|uniref:hypothetical protein n=1 Tax=Leptolyngbya iicbica TaxID=3161580 RepID=UPI0005847CD3|nr:hypothetical protein [Leptolyngbya sp. LK]